MKKGKSSSGSKVERKTIEKIRRNLMKNLCSKLVSIIPDDHFNPGKELLSQQDQLGKATEYIKLQTEKIENLKKKKQEMMMAHHTKTIIGSSSTNFPPTMEIVESGSGSSLEVVLITGPTQNFVVGQVIGILEEEGAQVVNSWFSSVGERIYHTFQAQVIIIIIIF
ncbi:basic helix-loop-helix (bHLH) DNA-bindingsuperfamily protein [Striga asiatica]|uniref:Basic helix-loop-helix (BHLH) DNA-bindingsuperfamily protein n=1 Tax=Striga asiatica TaxID=4170 RepID=A0A5A7R6V8_STRAF|nr:basic helix-loop-helix (bHLH) DNA-bindingsuperfamily protein [Striga asiatica]